MGQSLRKLVSDDSKMLFAKNWTTSKEEEEEEKGRRSFYLDLASVLVKVPRVHRDTHRLHTHQQRYPNPDRLLLLSCLMFTSPYLYHIYSRFAHFPSATLL